MERKEDELRQRKISRRSKRAGVHSFTLPGVGLASFFCNRLNLSYYRV